MTTCAVVPVKAFALAKSRLRGWLTDRQREMLARAMLEDMLDVLQGVRGLDKIVVVTADAEAAALAARRRATVVEESPVAGLNAAVATAARQLERSGTARMIVLPADLPGLLTADVEALIEAHPSGRALTIAPSHDSSGTNGLVLNPPCAIDPTYGHDSFPRHLQAALAAGLETCCVRTPGLLHDLDVPRDVEALAAFRLSTRTWRCLSDWGRVGGHTTIWGRVGNTTIEVTHR